MKTQSADSMAAFWWIAFAAVLEVILLAGVLAQ